MAQFKMIMGGANEASPVARDFHVDGSDLSGVIRRGLSGYAEKSGRTLEQIATTMQIDVDELHAFVSGECDAPIAWISKICALSGLTAGELFGMSAHTGGLSEDPDARETLNLSRGMFSRLAETWPVEFAQALAVIGPLLVADPHLGRPMLAFLSGVVDAADASGYDTAHIRPAVRRAIDRFLDQEAEITGDERKPWPTP